MQKTVLLLETVAEEADALLHDNVRVLTAYGERPMADILQNETIHAVITRGKGQVNQALLDACPALEVVARCGVGLDNVDVQAATARGIRVINAPGANAATIAEHAMSLMLMLVRNMYNSVSQVRAGNWNGRNQYSGDELTGKTLGILGLGNIGRRVARLAEAFGMQVVYWDLSQNPSVSYQALPLEELLGKADVISLHLPLTSETDRLLNADRLALLKPGAFLINTARGGLIDEQALLNALNDGKLAGFGADVLTEEPPAADDLISRHPKTMITAHVGSLTATTYRTMCMYTVQNVLTFLAGETPAPESVFNRVALGL